MHSDHISTIKSKSAGHTEDECVCVHLSGCVWLLVAGQDLQHHTATGVLQHLLQHFGVVAHLFAIDLFNDVSHVQQTLLVDHAAVKDPGDHQLATLHTKCYALNAQTVTK